MARKELRQYFLLVSFGQREGVPPGKFLELRR
jgi:hypothetical protein